MAGCRANNETASSTASQGHAEVRRQVCSIVPFPVEANGVDAALRTRLHAAGNGNYGMTGFPCRAGRQPRNAPWIAELASILHLLVELAKLGNPSYEKQNRMVFR